MCNHNYTDWGFSRLFSFINNWRWLQPHGKSGRPGSEHGSSPPPPAGWMALDRSPPLSGLLLLASSSLMGVRLDSSDVGGFCDVFGSTLSGVLWSTAHTPLLGW